LFGEKTKGEKSAERGLDKVLDGEVVEELV
jgi:hypothetical protein